MDGDGLDEPSGGGLDVGRGTMTGACGAQSRVSGVGLVGHRVDHGRVTATLGSTSVL
jgi:hypothetical protein